MHIPDEAVEAAVEQMQRCGWTGGYDAFGDDLRTVLAHALPFILGEPVAYMSRDGNRTSTFPAFGNGNTPLYALKEPQP
ncbi:hypothetical protein [Pseudoxanthomonas winnipegensis]|uniref:hypothetical protein n=1 Tax=Pseudoxanthomonas winnipegensis TaxID=2480810 RepID=UPI00102D921B|nr:hypothetical protein [Pseudoxanthomonas winnipegensis]RZZ85649.1 hypothetical protein EA663_11600 [Pseudoxanthomonas winnipegensis]